MPPKSPASSRAKGAADVPADAIRSRSAAIADSLIPSLSTGKLGTFEGLLAWCSATSCQLLLQTEAPELPGSVSDV